MNVKRYIIAAAATAGAGALVFGGTAVSTSFSSQAGGNVHATGETIALSTQNSNLSLAGLRPGGTVESAPFTLTNNGADGELTLLPLGWQVNKNGSNDAAPIASEVTVFFYDVNRGQHQPVGDANGYNLATLQNQTTDLGPYPHGFAEPITVAFKLAQNAGNEWNGADVDVPFTLHLQDSGV